MTIFGQPCRGCGIVLVPAGTARCAACIARRSLVLGTMIGFAAGMAVGLGFSWLLGA